MSQFLDEEAFGQLLALTLSPLPSQCALAFSGGCDSLTLLYLLTRFKKIKICALTVDHQLRPESTAQAQRCAELAQFLGVEHCTLTWEGEKPTSNIQCQARDKRYALIENYCSRAGIQHVFLAHHLDDQAETFLLRLMRASGVDGLSCMLPVTKRKDITYVRPLLSIPKKRLEDTLQEADLLQYVIDDPSNERDVFTRVRFRKAMPFFKEIGLLPERLGLIASHMQRAQQALETYVDLFFTQYVHVSAQEVSFNWPAWLTQPQDIQLRILVRSLQAVNHQYYKPRFPSLKRVSLALHMASFRPMTLGHCLISLKKENVLILKESQKRGKSFDGKGRAGGK